MDLVLDLHSDWVDYIVAVITVSCHGFRLKSITIHFEYFDGETVNY